jgi:hypothetical protein
MAYEACPRCGSLREVLDFCKPGERLEPCGYCHDPESVPVGSPHTTKEP